MDTEEIKQTTETKHLGIKRNNKNNIDIEDRIKLPRRTIYALLGPGLHARRGMSPVVAYKLWKTYVIPRALYGIEVMNHTASDNIQLEKYVDKSRDYPIEWQMSQHTVYLEWNQLKL